MKQTCQIVGIIVLMLLFSSCNSEKREWKKVQTIYTVQAFGEFLLKHPEGDYYTIALKAKEMLEKLQEPDFISWLSNKSESEIGELKKDGNFDHNSFNIKKWETLYTEWNNISEPFLIEEMYYTSYGVQDSAVLKNSKGIIAKKVIFRSPYNPMQVTGYGYQYPDSKDELFFVIDLQGEFIESSTISHTKKFLCLDNKGRIIKENGAPKFLPTFNASQKTTFRNEYDGAWIEKTTTTIYPCEDCNSTNKEISFVWQ